WLYLAWRLLAPLRLARHYKILAALLLLPIAEYHSLLAAIFGFLSAVELPRRAMITLAFAFGSLFIAVILLLLRELVCALLWLLARPTAKRLFASYPLTLALMLVALLLGAMGTWQGVKQPAIKQVDIALSGLPAAFDGYRVVQL